MALNFLNDGYFAGKVGIGTASPQSGVKLDIRGNVRIGDGSTGEQDIHFVNDVNEWQVGTNNGGNGTDNNQFFFYEGGNYRLTLQKGGNVGIGTAIPSQKLHSYITTGDIYNLIETGSNVSTAGSRYKSSAQEYFAGLQYSVNAAYQIYDITGGAARMTILSGGNVGIGTDSPERKLHVQNGSAGTVTSSSESDLVVESSLDTAINILSPDSRQSSLYFGSPSDSIGSQLAWKHSTKLLILGTAVTSGGEVVIKTGNNAEKMRITSAGGISFGSTGTAYGGVGQVLTSAGNASPTWTTPTTGTVTGTGAANRVTWWDSATNITSDAGFTYNGLGRVNTDESFGVSKNGADTVADGPFFRLTNAAQTIQYIWQLDASNNIDYWYYNGSTWTQTISLLNNGGATFAGDVIVDSALLSNQENTDVDTGTETVASVAIATYTAAFFDFVIKKTTNVRSGTVYACHDGTSVAFTETSTQDLGDTSDVTLSVDISGTDMRLRATTTSDDWSIKSLIRAI